MDNKTEKMLNPTKTRVKLKTYFVYDDPQQILFWSNIFAFSYSVKKISGCVFLWVLHVH